MKKALEDLQEKHYEKIMDELGRVFYRLKRYSYKYTTVLFYSDLNFDYNMVKDEIRMTDLCIKLEKNLFLLIFEDTDLSEGIRASEKLLSTLLQSSNQNIYLAIEECREENEGVIILHKLFTLLDFAMDNNHINEVIDNSYLDSIY